jgi:hypothetical protein
MIGKLTDNVKRFPLEDATEYAMKRTLKYFD